MYRIHIVGAPRSGTTSMHEPMVTCFKIDGATKQEVRLWRHGGHGHRACCATCPGDEILAFPLIRFDRNLHFVYMLRDPRDVIVGAHGRTRRDLDQSAVVARGACRRQARHRAQSHSGTVSPGNRFRQAARRWLHVIVYLARRWRRPGSA